ncbi:undecaprenyl-diphosphate phosphatase [Modicisalibacter tunisiensis]|uniref:undecaprenyl-diphosphate phosphatase n=1 Tax=Modicisalibacter tunisiensis TaxID=390637 RepID=UPI001CCC6E78|nr:undecaprenyl-diphosphate phosphatase [Modicisalibacter tunisiensis]MBZ9539295.1 undecaprenyl-diphosphate phosphatase [Modicisalibacter tunisiensis]
MDWLQLVALSVIQGLTEFLPISSSAHLILPSQVLGWPDQGLAFDVAVHIGTLAAVLLAFRREVVSILGGWFGQFAGAGTLSSRQTPESRLGWMVILATIPAVIVGGLFNGAIENSLRSSLVIALATLIFGVLLGWADWRGSRSRDLASLTFKAALIIGLFQALALIPGTSRSGITITAALLLGFDRQSSARFSFLLSIPLIIAAGSLKGLELMQTGSDAAVHDVLVGIGLSFVAALVCIKLFLAALDRIGMWPFVAYRLLLGVALLWLWAA